MEDSVLNQIHRLDLIIADELKRICEKNNLRYFMFYGTLLGAIRHGGFIPWDDDMDFGMPREDFEKFIQVCERDLDKEKFYLQTDRKEKKWPFNFVKIRLNNTYVEEEFTVGTVGHHGIYIDILPIDNISDNRIVAEIQYKLFWFFRNVLWLKCGYGSENTKKQWYFKLSRVFPLSIKQLKYFKHKSITLSNKKNTKYVVTSDAPYGLKKDTIKAKWIQSISNYKFEDRIYPGIADYDEYLKYIYGDYMKLPPVEKRNHHARLNVDFGPYQIEER